MPVALSEDQESIELAIWLDRRNILYTHVPNGGLRNRVEAAKFQRMGVKRGVPDYLIFTPSPRLPHLRGVAIEMKRALSGNASTHQKRWLKWLGIECHWCAMLCHGHKAAIDQLTELGYDREFS